MPTRINVRELRDQLGMSRKEFGQCVNASTRTVRRWENGEAEPSQMAMKHLESAREQTGPRRREAVLT